MDNVPEFPEGLTAALVGLEITFTLALLISQSLGLEFVSEREPLVETMKWHVSITLFAMVVPLWALISELWAPHCFNYIALVVLYAISIIYFSTMGALFVVDESGTKVIIFQAVAALSFLLGALCMIHLIIVSVYVGRHRKQGSRWRAGKAILSTDIERVERGERDIARVMSTHRSSEGTLFPPDIAHYSPGGINPLRMNLGDEGISNTLSPRNKSRAISMSDMSRLGSLEFSQGQLRTELPEAAMLDSRQPIGEGIPNALPSKEKKKRRDIPRLAATHPDLMPSSQGQLQTNALPLKKKKKRGSIIPWTL